MLTLTVVLVGTVTTVLVETIIEIVFAVVGSRMKWNAPFAFRFRRGLGV
jgi:hypothetical protein